MYLRSSNRLSQILIKCSRLPLAAHLRLGRNVAPQRRICLVLVLLLAMLIGLRTGYLKSALEVAFISPAIAHEHHNGGGHEASYGSGGHGSGCYGPQGSSQHGDNGGGGNGHIGHGAGSASSYNGLGGGGAAPHGDGKLSPAGMPQPEVAGLPSDHELHGAKDDKPWEKLLNEHLGAHFPAGDAGDHLEHNEPHESDHGLPSQHWDAHSTAGIQRPP